MRLFLMALVAILCASSAKAELVFYAVNYVQNGENIILNAQEQPIPVPSVGSVIEVYDGIKRVSGYVTGVYHQVQRSAGTPGYRFFTMQVNVSSAAPRPFLRRGAKMK